MAKFNPSLHPRGPNGRFTRSYAKQMSALDGRKESKVRSGFKAKVFAGAEDARAYLSNLFGTRKSGGGPGDAVAPGSGLSDLINSGAFTKANQTLRSGKTGPEADSVEALMRPLPDDLQLFRQVPRDKLGGASGDPTSLKNFKVSDAGYFPTTIAPTQPGPDTVQMKISAPAGTPAAVDPDSGQVVLGGGVEMAVGDVQVQPDGSTSMDLVVLPDGDAPPRSNGSTAPSPEPASSETAPRSFAERVSGSRRDTEALSATPLNLLDPDGPPPLTPEQERGLDSYQSEDYRGINHILRGGDEARLADFYLTPEGVQQTIAAVDSAMEQSRLADEIVTLRGIRNAEMIFGDRIGGDLSGMEWNEDAYVSTTTDEDVAYGFIQRSAGQPVIMRMIVPPPTGAIQLSDDTYESEVMLQRGLRMRVVADNGVNEDGVRMLDIEVIPPDGT